MDKRTSSVFLNTVLYLSLPSSYKEGLKLKATTFFYEKQKLNLFTRKTYKAISWCLWLFEILANDQVVHDAQSISCTSSFISSENNNTWFTPSSAFRSAGAGEAGGWHSFYFAKTKCAGEKMNVLSVLLVFFGRRQRAGAREEVQLLLLIPPLAEKAH